MPRWQEDVSSATGRAKARYRLQAFNRIGWSCACCGERHPFLLTFHHINEDGKDHRLRRSVYQVYRDIATDPDSEKKYQTLCLSCNWAKHIYGECPHKSGISSEEAVESIKRKARLRRKIPLTMVHGFQGKWIPMSVYMPNTHKRFMETT